MVLSWITRSKRPHTADDLIARGRYRKAIDVMREEFAVRFPGAAERLRFADVLTLAGRDKEALPILLGVADEQERYGFRDKALEALRRAEKIAPADPEVVERLELFRTEPTREAPPETPEEQGHELGGLDGAIESAFAATLGPAGTTETEATAAGAPGAPEGESGAGLGPEAPAAGGAVEQGEDELDLPAEDLQPIDDVCGDARALLRTREATPLLGERALIDEEELELELRNDAHALLSGKGPEPGARSTLETSQEWEEDIQADARALLTREGSDTAELHGFVLAVGAWPGAGRSALGRVLFAQLPREELQRVEGGVRPLRYPAGELIVREGDPGDSIFLVVRGSVQLFIAARQSQPFEIRRIDAGDFFGEAAALAGHPRAATAVATTACALLEVDRQALDVLVALRPAARTLLGEAGASGMQGQEGTAVEALLPAADPERAAAALKAHFGDSEWSPRVRLHLARLLLDVGREDDALAILADVAQDLARRGQAQKAIGVLKKVERIQRRGIQEVCLAPLKGRRRKAARRARAAATAVETPEAFKGAAFREWLGSVLRETADLADHTAAG